MTLYFIFSSHSQVLVSACPKTRIQPAQWVRILSRPIASKVWCCHLHPPSQTCSLHPSLASHNVATDLPNPLPLQPPLLLLNQTPSWCHLPPLLLCQPTSRRKQTLTQQLLGPTLVLVRLHCVYFSNCFYQGSQFSADWQNSSFGHFSGSLVDLFSDNTMISS